MKQLIGELIGLTRDHGAAVEGLRKNLLDPGGQLERMTKNTDDKLRILHSAMASEFGAIRDLITADRLKAGRQSEPFIKTELPISALVVDDDPMVCRAIQEVLSDSGISAHAALDGEDALSILNGELPIDLCIVDLRMPKNGKGLAATILAEHPRVNVMIISGNGGEAATQALALGAHCAMGKPFSSNEALVLAVIRCAEHRRLRVHGSRPTP